MTIYREYKNQIMKRGGKGVVERQFVNKWSQENKFMKMRMYLWVIY